MEHEAEDIRFDHELAKACHRCRVVWVTALVTMEVGGGRAGGAIMLGRCALSLHAHVWLLSMLCYTGLHACGQAEP